MKEFKSKPAQVKGEWYFFLESMIAKFCHSGYWYEGKICYFNWIAKVTDAQIFG